MKLYNTLSRRPETLEPREKEVSVYVCGITPYDTTHLGHAFTYAVVDVLNRYLELRDLKVKYAQNVTDIDDDILRKAKEVGEDWRTVVNRWTRHYIRDMQNLNVQPPDHFPRATDVIPEIIRWVKKLLDKGFAYAAGGSVYYNVDSWPEFGKLSQLSRSEMLQIANERGNHPDDPNKRDPLDFVLWQAQAPGEPAWESPWGPGRPGWHIECSTMVIKYLGEKIDIHGGGSDLSFPHHECEIAEVEPVTGKEPFVRYWLHAAMVRFEGEKMSKSLGNLVMVSDLLNEYSADALRVYLGQHHYREAWSYDEDELKKAARLAEKIKAAALAVGGDGLVLNEESAWAAFTADMDNDLDTPGALRVLDGLAEGILDAARVGRDVREAQGALRLFGKVFGLRMDQPGPEQQVIQGWEEHAKQFV